jgi:hypothetical protein
MRVKDSDLTKKSSILASGGGAGEDENKRVRLLVEVQQPHDTW